MKYLLVPRVLAAVISMPLLVLTGDVIGVLGGFLFGVERLGFGPEVYVRNSVAYLVAADVTSGLIKAAVFGFLLSLSGCYHGFTASRGAEGVGRATTNAVVVASILILVSNYLLTEAFF